MAIHEETDQLTYMQTDGSFGDDAGFAQVLDVPADPGGSFEGKTAPILFEPAGAPPEWFLTGLPVLHPVRTRPSARRRRRAR